MSVGLIAIFPLTTCAASAGISDLQSMAAQSLVEEHEEAPQPEPIMEEYYELDTNPNVRELQTEPAESRGTSVVDVNVYGTEQVAVATVSLSKGDTVKIYLYGDNETDKFQAGLKDSSGGKKYVIASDGTAEHRFTISDSGTYKIFVEGRTSKNIHVVGSYNIR